MGNSPLENHISRYKCTQTVKEKVVLEVFYQGMDIHRAVQEYGLPRIYTLQLWLRQFQKRLDGGMIVLPPMPKEQKATLQASGQRIKELEKALE